MKNKLRVLTLRISCIAGIRQPGMLARVGGLPLRLLILLFLGLAAAANAGLQLNGLFTSQMVLQRHQVVPVWGTADPGAEITVQFAGQQAMTTASPDGSWRIHLKALDASVRPQTLLARSSVGNQEVALTNVLVGDVWLCGGQSNMAETMDRFRIWERIKQGFTNDQLRLFKIKQGGVGSAEPTKELVVDPFFQQSWQVCTPEFAARFSAAAGFFGMKLQRDTGVPVGLLYANRGGTAANSWLPREVLAAHPRYARFLDPSNSEWKPSKQNPDAIRAPSHLYNGTIYPLAPFAIRGVIWYQGESDSQWSELYADLFADVIQSWRQLWGYDFPFLYVQLAPHAEVPWDRVGEARAWIRDAQFQVLQRVPHTGMAVITDAGEGQDIHPQAKDMPGERLALLAESLGDPKVNADFPILKKMTIADGKAVLQFDGVASGLEARRVAMNLSRGYLPGEAPDAVVALAGQLAGFVICGADHQFVPANAEIVGPDTVVVSSPAVKAPVAVRYGWANFPLCNLYGGNGMPASPFRTDHFPPPNFSGKSVGQPFQGIRSEWGDAMTSFAVADGKFQSLELDGVKGWQAEGSYLYFRSAAAGPRQGRLTLLYRDEGFATLQLRYDSSSKQKFTGDRPGVWKPGGEIELKNSKTWKVATFDLPDARFEGGCNGADLRFQSTGAMTIGGVYFQDVVR
jgi:sialate O-acetylesterase